MVINRARLRIGLVVAALALAAWAGLAPRAASAAGPGPRSAQGAGTAQASVVRSVAIFNVTALRFGRFTRPTTAGTIQITPAGAITTTGSMTGATAIGQAALGRGPASFLLVGEASRQFSVTLPASAQIASGTSRMTLSGFASNAGPGPSRLGTSGVFVLVVGATLTVAANQPVGTYSGTYPVTVGYQ